MLRTPRQLNSFRFNSVEAKKMSPSDMQYVISQAVLKLHLNVMLKGKQKLRRLRYLEIKSRDIL